MPLNLTPKGARFIQNQEGCSLKLYLDADGHLTIGYGHLVIENAAIFKGGISVAQAQGLFDLDIKRVINALNQIKPLDILPPGNCQDAVISFVFNIGIYAFEESTMLRDIALGNLRDVPDQMKRWVKGKRGNVIAGLEKRRAAEAEMFQQGLDEVKK